MTTPERTIQREEAAALIGIAAGTLRNWNSAARGPRPLKTTPTQQGRALYRVRDVAAWQTDPAGYERRAWRDRHRGSSRS